MEQKAKKAPASGAESLKILAGKYMDGTWKDVIRDWKWILSLCRGHWWSIALYTLCGIGASAIALASGVASKYLIDCIVAMDRSRLLPLAAATVAGVTSKNQAISLVSSAPPATAPAMAG